MVANDIFTAFVPTNLIEDPAFEDWENEKDRMTLLVLGSGKGQDRAIRDAYRALKTYKVFTGSLTQKD